MPPYRPLSGRLNAAQNDPGFREAVHLMVQLAGAGTTEDVVEHMAAVGVELAAGWWGADFGGRTD